MMVLIHTSNLQTLAIRHTYSGISVIDEVLQIEEGGIRVWFEVLQEEGGLQLLTLLSLQTVREDLHGHLLVVVQSPLGILQHHLNDATPGARVIFHGNGAMSGGAIGLSRASTSSPMQQLPSSITLLLIVEVLPTPLQ